MLNKIKNGILYLPLKDLVYAKRFIEGRDFESLLELVDSSIIKLERKKEEVSEELYLLKTNVNSYCSLLDISDFDNFEDYD